MSKLLTQVLTTYRRLHDNRLPDAILITREALVILAALGVPLQRKIENVPVRCVVDSISAEDEISDTVLDISTAQLSFRPPGEGSSFLLLLNNHDELDCVELDITAAA